MTSSIPATTTPSYNSTTAKVFISYKRDVEPDQTIARRVFEALEQRGHAVFLDRTMTVGQKWAEEIERNIGSADCLIVFLTAASSRSEMVKGELEMARKKAEAGGIPRILPVRLGYAGPLPYPLNAWLDPIQNALWRGEADTERLVDELLGAVCGQQLSCAVLPSVPASVNGGPPLYSAPLPPPGGVLDVEDPWYIRRDCDDVAASLIAQQGVTIIIKGSGPVGKSSLLIRTLAGALEHGKKGALIDFQLLGKDSLRSGAEFFRRFADSVADQLELDSHIAQSWAPELSDPQNLTRYLEKQVLQRIGAPLVLAIDEADMVLESDFHSDFFGMLRSWHNMRAHPLKRIWKKLDLVLVTSTEPHLLIDRDNESPFNVGQVLGLSDFTRDQVQELNLRHNSPLYEVEIARLFDLLSGHPYLTRKAFFVLRSGLTPDQLFLTAYDDAGPFGDHLRNYFLRLLNDPRSAAMLKQVMQGRGCEDGRVAYQLQRVGLVKFNNGKVVPRCKLYWQYFRDRL